MTDVRIPDSCRVGDVGAGRKVAMTTLMKERANSGRGSPDMLEIEELIDLARKTETESGLASDDAATREKLARWYSRSEGLRYFQNRMRMALPIGERVLGLPGEVRIDKEVPFNELTVGKR